MVDSSQVHPICFLHNRTGPFLGNLSLSACKTVLAAPPTCVNKRAYKRQSGIKTKTSIRLSDGKRTICHPRSPGDAGTRVLDGYYWLCDHTVHLYLALGHLSDHTDVVYAAETTLDTTALSSASSLVRARRAAATYAPHDAIWGTNVPEDFKVFPKSSKVALYPFLWTGVGKLLLFSDILHYRLLQLTNLTIDTTSSICQELTAIRLMVLQNRMVLDLMTAPQGGVCHLVGKSCCTYNPETTLMVGLSPRP